MVWKNVAERVTLAHTLCWITISTHIHTQNLILIAFPLNWLHKHASMLCYTYVGCLIMKEFHDAFCFKHFQHMVKLAKTMRATPKDMSSVVLHKLQDTTYTKIYMADSASFFDMYMS
jgi:hypothetical protein